MQLAAARHFRAQSTKGADTMATDGRERDEPGDDGLRASIWKWGVLVPIELDDKGEVLDGHRRLRICRELGVKDYPCIIRCGLSEAEKREHVAALHLCRRHLGAAEQRKARAARILTENPELSDRLVAEQAGLSDKTVARVRRVTADIPQLDRRVGKDGRTRPLSRASAVVVE